MILTVVDRFKSPLDVMRMKKSQLIYFYDGAMELNKADNDAFKKAAGK